MIAEQLTLGDLRKIVENAESFKVLVRAVMCRLRFPSFCGFTFGLVFCFCTDSLLAWQERRPRWLVCSSSKDHGTLRVFAVSLFSVLSQNSRNVCVRLCVRVTEFEEHFRQVSFMVNIFCNTGLCDASVSLL